MVYSCCMINRSAVTVRAKQPFLDWLRQLPDPVGPEITLESINDDRTVYLLPEEGDDEEAGELLAQFFDIIFESELEAWWTGDSDWPPVTEFDVFKEWFDIEHHSVIEDLTTGPIVDDDLAAE